MSEYLVLKWIHVVSSTILFGTGIGSAFYMLVASLDRDARVVFFVTRWVVVADWIFTTTAVIVQPLTGFWLAHLAGFPLTSRWIVWSTALYLLAGGCWLPVVWMQMQMREMAREAAGHGRELPPRYWRFFRIWIALGIPAFLALVVVFYLMVAKPA
ncbi:MAG TPA: DUF2269 domain-containing protein [Usitatibacter sp.]|nr:DUF2269 domain-containing protein [Usitatibacter sp.]